MPSRIINGRIYRLKLKQHVAFGWMIAMAAVPSENIIRKSLCCIGVRNVAYWHEAGLPIA
jgi:hypothetical protein